MRPLSLAILKASSRAPGWSLVVSYSGRGEGVEMQCYLRIRSSSKAYFPLAQLLGSFSPIVGEIPLHRVLQSICSGCLRLWLCCALNEGGVSFWNPCCDWGICFRTSLDISLGILKVHCVICVIFSASATLGPFWISVCACSVTSVMSDSLQPCGP